MKQSNIVTSEEDSGLWGVYRNGTCLGYIYDPLRLSGDKPDYYIALDDWLSIEPGNPIEMCPTWHKALSAVVQYRNNQLPTDAASGFVDEDYAVGGKAE